MVQLARPPDLVTMLPTLVERSKTRRRWEGVEMLAAFLAAVVLSLSLAPSAATAAHSAAHSVVKSFAGARLR